MNSAAAAPPTPAREIASALRDVNAILAELVAAADEQYEAVAAADLIVLERVTRRQEVLAARLARAEQRRLAASSGRSLADVVADEAPAEGALLQELVSAVAVNVLALQERHLRNTSLVRRGAELAGQTVQFLQRLVAAHERPYGGDGAPVVTRSLLVDGRA